LRCGDIFAARSELTDVLNGCSDNEALLWPLTSLLGNGDIPDALYSTTTHTWAQEVLFQLRVTSNAP
jgi:hypothetical protein